MKKWIAFTTGSHSSIGTEEEAKFWAARQFVNNKKCNGVYLAEVRYVVQPITEPQVTTRLYEPAETPLVPKLIDAMCKTG